jgi:hypothetical protein
LALRRDSSALFNSGVYGFTKVFSSALRVKYWPMIDSPRYSPLVIVKLIQSFMRDTLIDRIRRDQVSFWCSGSTLGNRGPAGRQPVMSGSFRSFYASSMICNPEFVTQLFIFAEERELLPVFLKRSHV